ncbi:MAG: biotin transporter BioY [Cloacibacillus sp.]
MEVKGFSVRELVLCAFFVALTAVGARIRVPVPVVPFTLQFLFTTLAGLTLGARGGAAAVGVYILLGLAGVPVFAEGGGPAYILQPTFGYLVGFAAGAWISGRVARAGAPSFRRFLFASFAGLGAVYGCGMLYCWLVSNFVLGTPIALGPLVLYCFVLAVPGDLLLCFVSAQIAVRVLERRAIFNVRP